MKALEVVATVAVVAAKVALKTSTQPEHQIKRTLYPKHVSRWRSMSTVASSKYLFSPTKKWFPLGFFEAINSRAEDANANNFYFLMCLKRDNFCYFYIDYLHHHQKNNLKCKSRSESFQKKTLKTLKKKIFSRTQKIFLLKTFPPSKKKSSSTFEDLKILLYAKSP